MKLDGVYELLHNTYYDVWERKWRIRFLAVDGESEAELFLNDLRRRDPQEFKAIGSTTRIVIENGDFGNNYQRVRHGKGRLNHIKELKKNEHAARVFSFYYGLENTLVCLNTFWKTSGVHEGNQQDAAWNRAEDLRQRFLAFRGLRG